MTRRRAHRCRIGTATLSDECMYLDLEVCAHMEVHDRMIAICMLCERAQGASRETPVARSESEVRAGSTLLRAVVYTALKCGERGLKRRGECATSGTGSGIGVRGPGQRHRDHTPPHSSDEMRTVCGLWTVRQCVWIMRVQVHT